MAADRARAAARAVLRRHLWRRQRWLLLGVATGIVALSALVVHNLDPGPKLWLWLFVFLATPTAVTLVTTLDAVGRREHRWSGALLKRLPLVPADDFRVRFGFCLGYCLVLCGVQLALVVILWGVDSGGPVTGLQVHTGILLLGLIAIAAVYGAAARRPILKGSLGSLGLGLILVFVPFFASAHLSMAGPEAYMGSLILGLVVAGAWALCGLDAWNTHQLAFRHLREVPDDWPGFFPDSPPVFLLLVTLYALHWPGILVLIMATGFLLQEASAVRRRWRTVLYPIRRCWLRALGCLAVAGLLSFQWLHRETLLFSALTPSEKVDPADPADPSNLMFMGNVMLSVVAPVALGGWVLEMSRRWRRRDPLLARLPVTHTAVVRRRLGALLRAVGIVLGGVIAFDLVHFSLFTESAADPRFLFVSSQLRVAFLLVVGFLGAALFRGSASRPRTSKAVAGTVWFLVVGAAVAGMAVAFMHFGVGGLLGSTVLVIVASLGSLLVTLPPRLRVD